MTTYLHKKIGTYNQCTAVASERLRGQSSMIRWEGRLLPVGRFLCRQQCDHAETQARFIPPPRAHPSIFRLQAGGRLLRKGRRMGGVLSGQLGLVAAGALNGPD